MSDFYDIGQEQKGARDYRIVLLETAVMLLIMGAAAFLFRAFLFQPFSIPGYAMSSTLLPGDHILGNKFIYGPLMPFTGKRLFTFKTPVPGDVVVFRDPEQGDRNTVKRCAALPGSKVKIVNKRIFVNNALFAFPNTAQAGSDFIIDGRFSPRDNLPEFRIPEKGDVVTLDSLALFEFDFLVNLIRQENPDARISHTADLLINGKVNNDLPLEDYNSDQRKPDGTLNFDSMSWIQLKNVQNYLEAREDSLTYGFKRTLFMDGRELKEYIIKTRAYLFVGDNWDDSMDGRYTGCVSEDRITARASLIYWSYGSNGINWRRLFLFI